MLSTLQIQVTVLSLLAVACTGCGPKGFSIPSLAPRKAVPPASAPKPLARLVVTAEAPPSAVPEEAEPTTLSDKAPAAEAAPTSEKPAAAETAPTSVPGKDSLYFDSFADLKDSVKKNVDGKTLQEVPGNTRTVYMFRGMPEEGALVLQVLEDMKTNGPDERPGVLALSWQEVPAKLPYSGFVYLGHADAKERMTLPPLLKAKSADVLQTLRLSFRYRAINGKATKPVKLSIGCRLEPTLPDSHKKRLDLGSFTATDEWGTLDINLKDGTNTEAFLRAIAGEKPTGFKIVWAQYDPITSYHAGDTLLIDDIVIKSAPAQ